MSSLGTVVLTLEGVLGGKDDDVDLTTTSLDPLGHALYIGLSKVSRLVIASAVERRFVEHWLRLNYLSSHQAVTALDDRLVARLRAGGENVELVIDANAERAAASLRNGVPTMLFTRPLYARAGHRPDLPQLQRPWAEVVAESQRQRAARALPVPSDDD